MFGFYLIFIKIESLPVSIFTVLIILTLTVPWVKGVWQMHHDFFIIQSFTAHNWRWWSWMPTLFWNEFAVYRPGRHHHTLLVTSLNCFIRLDRMPHSHLLQWQGPLRLRYVDRSPSTYHDFLFPDGLADEHIPFCLSSQSLAANCSPAFPNFW